MTTQKTVTAEDVEIDADSLMATIAGSGFVEEVKALDYAALARLRDTAAHVPAVQVKLQDAERRLAAERAASAAFQSEASALQARVEELEGLLHVAGQHRDAAIDREDVLRARVAELERQQEATARSLKSAMGNAERAILAKQSAESERDALRARVDEAADILTDTLMRGDGEAVETLARRTLAALSAPPAEAKRSCARHSDCDSADSLAVKLSNNVRAVAEHAEAKTAEAPKMSHGYQDAQRQREEARSWREAVKRYEEGNFRGWDPVRAIRRVLFDGRKK